MTSVYEDCSDGNDEIQRYMSMYRVSLLYT